MIRIVIAVDVVPGHEAEWEEQWRMLREVRSHFPGFRGASLLRDSEEQTRYLSLSEWDGHDELARAMRWMTWLSRDTTLPWTQGPLRVYDEVVDSVGETPGRTDRQHTVAAPAPKRARAGTEAADTPAIRHWRRRGSSAQ